MYKARWISVDGGIPAGYADGAGLIPALGRVRHRRNSDWLAIHILYVNLPLTVYNWNIADRKWRFLPVAFTPSLQIAKDQA